MSWICRCESGSWFDHVLEWWEAAKADPEHVLFLKYESILADPEDNIRKIADFAGIQYDPEIIAKVTIVQRLSQQDGGCQSSWTLSGRCTYSPLLRHLLCGRILVVFGRKDGYISHILNQIGETVGKIIALLRNSLFHQDTTPL